MDDETKKNKDRIIFNSGKTVNKKTWIMSTLRRASYRFPPRNEAERLARVDRGLYKCAMCEGTFKRGEYAIDHIQPVVPNDGFPIHPITGGPDWTIIIERLFCDIDGFQILCNEHHELKTSLEDSLRATYNQEKKELEKQKKKEEKLSKIKK